MLDALLVSELRLRLAKEVDAGVVELRLLLGIELLILDFGGLLLLGSALLDDLGSTAVCAAADGLLLLSTRLGWSLWLTSGRCTSIFGEAQLLLNLAEAGLSRTTIVVT